MRGGWEIGSKDERKTSNSLVPLAYFLTVFLKRREKEQAGLSIGFVGVCH